MEFAPGDRVLHPRHGPGKVLRLLSRGRVWVRFDRFRLLPRTVAREELRPEREEAPKEREEEEKPGRKENGPPGGGGGRKKAEEKPRTKLSPPPRVPLPATSLEADYRQTLEGLRLGVVPARHVREYTVGRDKELKNLRRFLEEGQGLRLIWGDYGAGKTHLIDLLEREALREGYLTSRIVLDPKEIPPSHPQRLYKAFLAGLRYPGDASQGWRPLFERLLKSKEHLEPGGASFSRFFSPVLFALATGDREVQDWASDYVEGYPMEMADFHWVLAKKGWTGPRPLALSDYRTYGRVYTHMLGTLASWASDAGFKGLLLLMDEVEYVDALTSLQRNLASQVLMHFAAAVLPEENLGFDPADLYRGGQPVHRKFEIRFRADQPLLVVMAFTPLEETRILASEIVPDLPEVHLRLEPLGALDFIRLVEILAEDFYRKAYSSFRPSRKDVREIRARVREELEWGDASPREAVRMVVLALDALRYGRDPFPEEESFFGEPF